MQPWPYCCLPIVINPLTMPDTANYAYLHTRVSILAEQLLQHEQREQLILKDSGQMEKLLQLAGLQLDIQDGALNSDSLEQYLITTLIDEAHVLTRSMQAPGKAFINHWMRRFELINLKLLLRSKFTRSPVEDIRSRMVDLGSLTGIPIDKLLATEDIGEFLRQLESTHYHAMAIQARQVYQEKQSLFDVESVLDSHYYHVLHRLANKLTGEHQRVTRTLLGAVLDQTNLVSLLRLRFSYQLGAPHAYFLLTPGGHDLGMPALLELAQQETPEQVLQKLPKALAIRLAGANSIGMVEAMMTKHSRHVAKHLLRSSSFNMGRAFAYLYLREQQTQLIHSVIKAQLLGLEQELVNACTIPVPEAA